MADNNIRYTTHRQPEFDWGKPILTKDDTKFVHAIIGAFFVTVAVLVTVAFLVHVVG